MSLLLRTMNQKNSKEIIMKFGGTSVGTPDAIRKVIGIVSSSKDPVAGIVVSAFANVTNLLIQATDLASSGDKTYSHVFLALADRHITTVHDLISTPFLREATMEKIEQWLSELESIMQGIFLLKESTPKILDTILGYGELFSAYIIAQTFIDNGIPAEFVDSRNVVKTDENFGSASVQLNITYKNIKKYFRKSNNSLKIITGYIGSTDTNETTTFGRGGSDYSASLFAVAIKAKKIEIWTDVNGVLTADPSKVPSAFTIPQLTYQEAMEMSHFGAKVIYPQTMIPAYTHNIPMFIRNTFQPVSPGTKISTQATKDYTVKGISSIKKVSLFLLQGSGLRGTPGIAARLFGALSQQKVNIILITQASSEYSICFAIDTENKIKAKKAIDEEFKHDMKDKLVEPIVFEDDLAIVAVVTENLVHAIGFDGKLFTSLGNEKISIKAIALGSSVTSISFVISARDEVKALKAIHKTFFEKHI